MNQIVQATQTTIQVIGNMQEGTVTMPLSEYHKLFDKAEKSEKALDDKTRTLEGVIYSLAKRLYLFELRTNQPKAKWASGIICKTGEKIELNSLEEGEVIRIHLTTI